MPIHGKQHPDCQRKPMNYDRDTTLPAAVASFRSATKKNFVLDYKRYKCATRKREKETGGGICFQFPPSGRCILLFMAGRGVFFFFRGGTGRFVFFSEAGRGVFFFFPRRDGVAFFFFFDGTGRGGVFFFFSRAGTGRLFLAVAIFLAGRGKIVTPSRQRRFKPSRQPSM